MSCDYHNRTDFRAFDVMVMAIDRATLPELKAALKTAVEFQNDVALTVSKRALWKSFAQMLRKHMR